MICRTRHRWFCRHGYPASVLVTDPLPPERLVPPSERAA